MKAKIWIALGGVALGFLAIELCARVALHEPLRWENFLARELDMRHAAYPAAFDGTLGWVPEPGSRDRENLWHTQVTIDDEGLRTNGAASLPRTAPSVLALGDSYTFGDDVSDGDTWPAALERELHRAVANAGVFGYGVDQAVLRGEALMPSLRPAVVVLGLYGDDAPRCEFSVRKGVGKPWFRLDGDGVTLASAVIAAPENSDRDLDPLRRLLGHSLVFDRLMHKEMPSWWLEGTRRTVREHADGVEVSARLMSRLSSAAARYGAQPLVVALPDERLRDEEGRACAAALARARAEGIAVLDLAPELAALRASDPQTHARLYSGHFSPAGNAWVAARIARRIRAEPRFQLALALGLETLHPARAVPVAPTRNPNISQIASAEAGGSVQTRSR